VSLRKIINLIIILFLSSISLFISPLPIKAITPFGFTETFSYPDGTKPSPGWETIFAECPESLGCHLVEGVFNNDGTIAEWIVEDQHYFMHVTSHQTLTRIFSLPINWPLNLNNYSVELDMFMMDNTHYDRNFVFRYQDLNHWYGIHTYASSVYLEKSYFNPETKANNSKGLAHASYPFSINQTYHFKVELNENHIKIFIEDNQNPLIDIHDPELPILSGRAGASTGSGSYSNGDVWIDNVKITSLSPTPTLAPTPTPTPTPTPPPTKVVLVPGMGASWNTKAILNCDLQAVIFKLEVNGHLPHMQKIFTNHL